MNSKRVSIVVLCGLIAGLAFEPSPADSARALGRRARVDREFSFSGLVSGPLTGLVLVGTESVVIGSRTHIYQVGVGEVEEGTLVTSAFVCASGVVRGDDNVALTVIVSESQSSRDFSETTLPDTEADPNRPR